MQKGILSLILFFTVIALQAGTNLDSIGVEKKNGKTYIIHKVEARETLYSLSRRYGVTVDEIRASNKDLKDLQIGQTVFIPSKNLAVVTSKPKSFKTHTVKSKETLYAISRKYDVSVEDLKKANPGVGELSIGQVINIPGGNQGREEQKPEVPENYTVQPKETFYSISRKFGMSVDEIRKLNPDVKELQVGQVLVLSGNANSDATNVETTQENESDKFVPTKTSDRRPDNKEKRSYVPVKDPKVITAPENNVPTFSNLKKDGYTKVNETGLAEIYQDNTEFHYALHKTAPIGTIIYVVNEENGQKVYVRVMGQLTDASSGVILKLSPNAFEKLAKGSNKVKVSATYIP